MKNTILKSIIYLCIVTFFASCTTTREITKSTDLQNYLKTGEIRVVTKDSLHYTLSFYKLQDSDLIGKGTVEVNNSPKSFDGKIKLTDIRYIECDETDLAKTIIGAGAVTVISYFLIHEMSNGSGVNNTVIIKAPVGCE